MDWKLRARVDYKDRIGLPDWDFPHYADYRCKICNSRAGPFFDDRCGKEGIDFICSVCHNEVVEVRAYWDIVDEENNDRIR